MDTAPGCAMPGDRTGIIHVHSDYSHDGKDSLEQLREFALERGISFIALTDHAEDFEPELFIEYKEHCKRLSDVRLAMIPGLEYRFNGYKGLHLLAMGLREFINPGAPEQFVEQASGAARLTCVAHPVLAKYQVPERVLNEIHAIEVWNASYNTRYLPDPRAINLLKSAQVSRPEVVGTAGLDQHDCSNDRGLRVVVHSLLEDPLFSIRAGNFTNVGKTMQFGPAVYMTAFRHRALRVARWGFDRVERTQDMIMRAVYPV